MDISEVVSVLSRWVHVVAGILWIGLLYWFNFVNIPFVATMDGDTKKKVVPELIPRALYWFRWGAAWTWITGIVLLFLVFYHGGLMYGEESTTEWGIGNSLLMLVLLLLAPLAYDALARSPLAKDMKIWAAVGFVIVGGLAYMMVNLGGFGYRAYVVHIGAMFGTIMAFNVWFRIWPSQKKVLAAVKAGTAPDAAVVSLVGARSRQNTYLSVPLVWAMINAHTTVPAADSPLYLMGVILIGWTGLMLIFKKAGKVKGF